MNLVEEGSNGRATPRASSRIPRLINGQSKVANLTAFSLGYVESDLRSVEDRLVSLIEQRSGALKGPAEVMFRNGGKRLRPALVLLCSRLLAENPENAIQIAAAVEMVHGASLIHDDVIDLTTHRRGKPTVNAVTGNQVAVLLGDFLLCQALLAVAELGRVELICVVSKAVADMTTGQILELRQQGNIHTTVEEYLNIVEGKTAALMEACCRLGALLSSANPQQLQAIGDFGRHLGMAFQITDDILDFWGSPELLGKPIGSDICDRKYTLPFLYAFEASEPTVQNELKVKVDGDLQRDDLQAIVKWMESHDTRQKAQQTAQYHLQQAREKLDLFPSSPSKDTLLNLLDYIVTRKS